LKHNKKKIAQRNGSLRDLNQLML